VYFKNFPRLFYLGFYHPKFEQYQGEKYENNYFNDFSDDILRLKDREWESIEYFGDLILELLEDEELVITTVPSHISGKQYSGIRDIAKYITFCNPTYIDLSYCLMRHRSIEQLSRSNGSRSKHIHLESIRVENQSAIENKNIVLLDDVITSGSSVEACVEILQAAGAKMVKTICLGKTIRDVEDTHEIIESKLQEFYQENDFTLYNSQKIIDEEFGYEVQQLDELSEMNDMDEVEYLDELSKLDNAAQQQHTHAEGDKYSDDMDCEQWATEAHEVLSGKRCFTPDNPFLEYL
jgi:hypoxanthine phosphoribosyltransferase